MADLFAPPTEKEVKESLLAPPTEQELKRSTPTFGAPAPTVLQGFNENILVPVAKGAAWAGEKFERFTGAPARAAISAALDAENPVTAFAGQFGRDSSRAPTGKDLAAKVGVSTEASIPAPWMNPFNPKQDRISPAGILGLGIDVLADPSNFIPIAGQIKGAAKGGLAVADIAAQAVAKGSDLALGTKMATEVYGGAKRAAKGLAEGVSGLVKAKVAPDFAELAKIAADHGIDPKNLPAMVEFGPDSAATQAYKANFEGPLGQAKREQLSVVRGQVREATDEAIRRLNGGADIPDKLDAGEMIRQRYNAAVREEMSQQDNSYRAVAERYPNLQIDRAKLAESLKPIRDKAEEMLSLHSGNPEISARGKHILGVLDVLEGTGEGIGPPAPLTISRARQYLRVIGEEAFSSRPPGMVPIDKKALGTVYDELRGGIMKSLEKADPEQASLLADHNKRIAKLFENRNLLEKHITNADKDGAQLFDSIFNGNVNRIAALRSILTPDEMGTLTATFLDGLRKEAASGEWTFGRFHQQLVNKEKFIKTLLFDKEAKEIDDLVKLGNRLGDGRLSTSGTGATLQFQDFAEGGPKGLKKALTGQAYENYLIKGAREEASKQGLRIPTVEGGLRLPNGTPVTSLNASEEASKINELLKQAPILTPGGRRRKAAQALSTQQTNEEKRSPGLPLPRK